VSVLSIFNKKSTHQTLVYKINVCFEVLLSLHHCMFHFHTVNVSQQNEPRLPLNRHPNCLDRYGSRGLIFWKRDDDDVYWFINILVCGRCCPLIAYHWIIFWLQVIILFNGSMLKLSEAGMWMWWEFESGQSRGLLCLLILRKSREYCVVVATETQPIFEQTTFRTQV
jgi:hypothetical protein